jgi:ribulose-phosphate 3-epimerase
MRKIKIAASLICADPLNLESQLLELIKANVDLIHFDVMDGSFVPRYGLYPEILKKIKSIPDCPLVDVHLMVENPEEYIDLFAESGADYFCFHLEATNHPLRVIKKIINAGMKPGVALNPNTSLDQLNWIIQDLDIVVLMTINPGIVGHKFINEMLSKIYDLRELANKHKKHDLIIEVDGGVIPENISELVTAGCDALVCGNGTIFRPHENTIFNKVRELRAIINGL